VSKIAGIPRHKGKQRGQGWRRLEQEPKGTTRANRKRLRGHTDMETFAGFQRKSW